MEGRERDRDPSKAVRAVRAAAPAIPFGMTRLGVAVIYMLTTAGLDSRSRELAKTLIEFARDHEERVAEPLLAALAST
jgi:hypothetical protein